MAEPILTDQIIKNAVPLTVGKWYYDDGDSFYPYLIQSATTPGGASPFTGSIAYDTCQEICDI